MYYRVHRKSEERNATLGIVTKPVRSLMRVPNVFTG